MTKFNQYLLAVLFSLLSVVWVESVAVGDLLAAPKTAGNAELGSLIRGVAGKNASAAEKVRLLTEGAGKIKGINFNRIADIPGAEAVFKGAPRALDGKSPVLAVLKDGRIFRGFDDALIPDPSGATSGLRILLNRLGELK